MDAWGKASFKVYGQVILKSEMRAASLVLDDLGFTREVSKVWG